ncbi:hypothetical protein [Romboutsia sp.]|uniref:hypothetical protein n=1 Tax=Romboutsia sp. TaxID=1965302 RepID=UPI002BF20106|nr:hypothetical protein [Romboutsia sp.]HSQ89743.1 hypothetical protein [Romboutsia sp.]
MDDNQKNNLKKAKKNCKDKNNSNSQEKDSLGLERFSYADYVLLSSTISYAISEELNDTDVNLILIFLGMVSADLAMLIAQREIKEAKKAAQPAEDIIVSDIPEEVIVSDLGRKSKKTKIRKKYVRSKKKNDC